MDAYDRWKTTPPEGRVIANSCAYCEEHLYEGNEVVVDGAGDLYFCNNDCARHYVEENINDYIEDVLDTWFVKTVIEREVDNYE